MSTPEIGACSRVFAGNAEGLRRINRPSLCGLGQVEQQRQYGDRSQNFFAHEQPPEMFRRRQLSKRLCPRKARLLLRPPEADIAGRRPNLQHGTASVQLAFGVERSRTPLVAFAGNMNVGEVGGNVMSIAQIDAGAHRERDIRRDVNGNISCRSFEPGIAGRERRFSRTSRRCRQRRSQPAPRELRRVRSRRRQSGRRTWPLAEAR